MCIQAPPTGGAFLLCICFWSFFLFSFSIRNSNLEKFSITDRVIWVCCVMSNIAKKLAQVQLCSPKQIGTEGGATKNADRQYWYIQTLGFNARFILCEYPLSGLHVSSKEPQFMSVYFFLQMDQTCKTIRGKFNSLYTVFLIRPYHKAWEKSKCWAGQTIVHALSHKNISDQHFRGQVPFC